jgi:hypothetical protein
MAAFLNYFKYKSTISNIVKSRVLVIGRNIENSVQASLQVGMQFMELGTMNALLTREKSSDRLVRGIDVFDSFGQIIYSTDRPARGREGPQGMGEISERSKSTEWGLEAANEYRRWHLAEEQLRPHGGLPRVALLLRGGGACRAHGRQRDPARGGVLVHRHRADRPARPDRRDTAFRARPEDARACR